MWMPPITIQAFVKQESNGTFSPSDIFKIVRKNDEEITNLEAKKLSKTNQSQEELQAALAKHFNKLKPPATRLHDILCFAWVAHIKELEKRNGLITGPKSLL